LLLTVFGVVSGAKINPLPAVEASKIIKPKITPQFAPLGAGNVTELLFDVVPDEPLDAVVVPWP